MATIYTHAFVGLGLGKIFSNRRGPLLFWFLVGFLPVVPDLDAFSSSAYGSIWGHRGFTHSLCFALAVAFLAAGLAFRFVHTKFWPLFGLFFIITASHGVLDALTDGGFGIPFFWPFSERRYGPCGPIHVQDIGFAIPVPRVSRAVRTELLYVWLPMLLLVGLVMAARFVAKRLRRKSA
jgi:inner membrane protein